MLVKKQRSGFQLVLGELTKRLDNARIVLYIYETEKGPVAQLVRAADS